MQCIFCKQRDANSEEHVFPDSLGGTLVINICNECNSWLGDHVDNHLVNHTLIQFARHQLRIKGKSGFIPNPFENGVLVDDKDQKLRYTIGGYGKPNSLYLIPKVKRSKTQDGALQVTFTVDAKDRDKLPAMVNKTLKRNGQTELTHEQIERLSEAHTIDTPNVLLRLEMDMVGYKRAILKIAYELARYWLGEAYLDDPIGDEIRRCVLDDDEGSLERHPIRGVIGLHGEYHKFPFWNSEPNGHIGLIIHTGDTLACYVRIFSVFEATVLVSKSASAYPEFKNRFLMIDPVTGSLRETSLDEEFHRLSEASLKASLPDIEN